MSIRQICLPHFAAVFQLFPMCMPLVVSETWTGIWFNALKVLWKENNCKQNLVSYVHNEQVKLI